ncbi:MAG: redox-sensing transcriptional repressor Rex [Firmicutes bacterium]|nr:redox-sensing transcriptional repressor Rex [Bacillota bacterium]
MKKNKIPEVTIMRLSSYSRVLNDALAKGDKIISSKGISALTGVSPDQVRKDFAYFGEFGVRGIGYNIEELKNNISKIIGTDRNWKVAIAGLGHLGGSLVSYPGFLTRGFIMAGIFDVKNIGEKYGNLYVEHIDNFETIAKKVGFDLGIIVVPKEFAQNVADIMIKSGIKAILNFAPIMLDVPENVEIKNVDLSMFLEMLSYYMSIKM